MNGDQLTSWNVEFRKSTYSDHQAQCVEVGVADDGGRWLRDSKNRNMPAHYFTPVEWQAFVAGVKDGEFG